MTEVTYIVDTGKLIQQTIMQRREIYFLVTEDNLSNIKTKGFWTDLFMLIFSLLAGAFVSVIIAKKASVSLLKETYTALTTYQWVFLIFALVFLLLMVIWYCSARKEITKIVKTTGVELRPTLVLKTPEDKGEHQKE
jgi:uncharacterized protein YqhQ